MNFGAFFGVAKLWKIWETLENMGNSGNSHTTDEGAVNVSQTVRNCSALIASRSPMKGYA